MIVALVAIAALAALGSCLLLPHGEIEQGQGNRVRVPAPMHSCSGSEQVDPR